MFVYFINSILRRKTMIGNRAPNITNIIKCNPTFNFSEIKTQVSKATLR